MAQTQEKGQGQMKWSNTRARDSARIYADAVLEACQQAKITDPIIEVITESDRYPRLQKISEVEYAIGWLHGCAEAHEVTVEVLWDQVMVEQRRDRSGKSTNVTSRARKAAS